MKRIILFAILTLVFGSCRDEGGDTPVSDQPLLGKPNFIIYFLTNLVKPDTVQIYKYYIKDSIVYSGQAFDKYPTVRNYFATYVYDNQKRLTKMYTDSKLSRIVEWNENTGIVRTAEGSIWDTVALERNHVVLSSAIYRGYIYDKSDNLIALTVPGFVNNFTDEFLEYSDNKINPFYLIRSLQVLWHMPFDIPYSRNIYNIRKTYPYRVDDIIFSTRYYNYRYQYDSLGRVILINSDYHPNWELRFEYK